MVAIENGVVTMTEEEYDALLDDSILLTPLKVNGVDNWRYYDHAQETYKEMKGEVGDASATSEGFAQEYVDYVLAKNQLKQAEVKELLLNKLQYYVGIGDSFWVDTLSKAIQRIND